MSEWKEYKLGDFDYNVTIDFNKLASKGFDNNEIEQLIKDHSEEIEQLKKEYSEQIKQYKS